MAENHPRPGPVVLRELAVRAWSSRLAPGLALAAILLLGGVLRVHGLAWDQPHESQAVLHMHPDERFLSLVADRQEWPASVGGYFDTANSPLNPYNTPDTHSYVYGTFPLFLAKAVSTLAGDDGPKAGDSYDTNVTWGRRITALTDTLTILLVFLLGATLFGRRAGLLGSLLYALAVLPTQLAHFWTMDPYVTFFGALTLWLACRAIREESDAQSIALWGAMGVAVGLGLASKVTAWPLVVAPVLAAACRVALRDFPRLRLRWQGESPARAARSPLLSEAAAGYRPPIAPGIWLTDAAFLCMALTIALVVFRVAQPYAFSGPSFFDMSINPRWRADIEREIDFQNGNVDFPPFVQFAGRTPFVTPLRNMVLFGLGPALGIAAWAALAAGAYTLFKRRELTFLLPLAFAASAFGFQGPRFVAFMRYFAPIYPVLCAMAGWGLVELWRLGRSKGAADTVMRIRRRWPRLRRRWFTPPLVSSAAAGSVIAVVLFSAWWALAFQNVYREEHPRIAASRWIYGHIPAGTAITYELWDDSLPYELPGQRSRYPTVETEPYQSDSTQKVHELVYGVTGDATHRGLDGAGYVAITSTRVRDSVSRLEREYPATIRYYELLESGELGFDLVATFRLRPSFLGLSIDDSGAEESFTVYDHPVVRLYRKSDRWDAARAEALLTEAHPERAVNLLPKQGRTNGLQFTAAEAAAQQAGGTFRNVFSEDGWTSHLPWLWWLAWLELSAIATVAWVTWLFRALPDRGYGLSKLVGMVSVVVPAWLAVAWGATDLSAALAWTAFSAVLVAGAVTAWFRRRALQAEIRRNWRTWLAVEGVFLLTFGAFLALRWFNPDTWHHPQGGEKPMELAYLTAVVRSTHLPPYDPWFAGGTMNYYYMGWFFLAVPMRALKILPEVAFNLGIPSFAAMAATVAFSTAHNLVGLGGRRAAHFPGRNNWKPLVATGILGSVMLVGLANLDGGHQAIERLQHVSRTSTFEGVPVLGGAADLVSGTWRWLFDGAALAPFDWWRSSRVHIGTLDITEFPYWSFLFADLHPHLMGLPFFGLATAMGVAYIATAHAGLRGQPWVLAIGLGVAVGLVRTIHTWDFPAALIIGGGSIMVGQVLARGRWDLRVWAAVAHMGCLAFALTIPFSPYTAHFEVFNSGVVRAPETTKANQYFAHFGLFASVAAAFIVCRYREELVARRSRPGRNLGLMAVAGRIDVAAFAVFISGLAVFTWPLGLTVVALSPVIDLFLVNLLWLEYRSGDRDVGRMIATALFALAFAIAAGVDVVTVKNDIVRMNTVFKFSLQAWQLFALASAYASWYVGRRLVRFRGLRPSFRQRYRWMAAAALPVFAVLLAGSLVFPWAGTRARQDRRFAGGHEGLDGLAYISGAVFTEDNGTQDPTDDVRIRLADDEPLIRWLRDNVQGSPVIVEAVGPLYHWTGRISMYTGLPAVIGWDWHQVQQRTAYTGLVQERRADTERFYLLGDTAYAELYLRKYNVSYVVVGTEELVYGSDAGLAKFDHMAALTKVFHNGPYAIYRVDQLKLRPAAN